jgi:hypothetical protein
MSDYNVSKIIKVNKCSFGIPKPDYILYYSVEQYPDNDGTNNTCIFTRFVVDKSSIYQTMIGPMCKNSDLTNIIGKYTANFTIYDIKDSDNNKQPATAASATYFLPEGSVTISFGITIYTDIRGNKILSPNNNYRFKILSGTLKYLNLDTSKSYVSISTNNTQTRLITFSFTYL